VVWTGFMWVTIGLVAGSYENGDEPLVASQEVLSSAVVSS
jgi:hypothetical protein